MIQPYGYSVASGLIDNTIWKDPDFEFKMSQMFYYDKKKECNYLQFKYLGNFSDLDSIKDDVKEYMLFLGLTAVHNSPSFRYYLNNKELLDLLVTVKFDDVNLLLRKLKLKIIMKKCTPEETSNYKFLNFFMSSYEKGLIEDVEPKELM